MISSSSPTSPASPPAPGQQQGAPAQAGLWCPCVVSQGRAQCSWLPAESQLGLDTAQPSWERWHSQTLQASREEMLPRQCHQPWEPTLNHPFSRGVVLCLLSSCLIPRRRGELPLRPKAAHPQPKGASGTATLLGRRALPRAASSSSLCNFYDNLLPSGPFVPDIVPAIPRAPSLPPAAEQGGGTGLAQPGAGPRAWCPEKR